MKRLTERKFTTYLVHVPMYIILYSQANDAKLQNDKVPQKNSLGWVKVQNRVYQKDCFGVNVYVFCFSGF